MEKRELMATVAPFIQGSAFIDTGSNGVRTTSELPLAGATVDLYLGTTLVASTTTGLDGGYLFNSGLTIGATYTVVESDAGYGNTGAQALSDIDKASVVAPDEIQVTVVDPNAVKATFESADTYGAGSSYIGLDYTFNGVTEVPIYATQLNFALSGAAGVNTAQFPSMCVGVNDALSGPPSPAFATTVDPQSALAVDGGEIGYLFNHYGATLPNAASLPLGVQGLPTKDVVAGVQVAIWELEYGASFALTGPYTGTSTTDFGDVQTAASDFLLDAAGKSEKVAILDATKTGALPAPAPNGTQSVLATETFNFGNAPLLSSSVSTAIDNAATNQPISGNPPAGTSVYDTATVTGSPTGPTPTGSVTYYFYNTPLPIFGVTAPVSTQSVTLGGGLVPNSNATAPLAVGSDAFIGVYSGDGNYAGSVGAVEPLTIAPASPAINTTQQPASAVVGSSIADTATVTGGYNPTGTVTFSLYNNANGTGTPLFTDTEMLVNGSATSKGYIATATATDYWVATYNGDSNNAAVTAPTSAEPVTITQAAPTINTTQQPATATVGTSIADQATVSGGYNPTGSVTFSLYGNSTGTGTPLFTDTESLVNGVATSKGYVATATATDYWVATYNGDSNNSSVTAPTASEPVTITPASPAINTTQQPASATVGTSIADQATVTGGYNPTGTVTFNLYNNPNGTGTPLFTDTEMLVGGVATSKGYIATATATDYWVATYNGDGNNASVTAPTASEPVTITQAAPTINTTQNPATATVGTSIADTATVSGGYNPTGTVTFTLYNNANGTGPALFTDTEALSGGSATSEGYIATATATDYWVATYNGDGNNASVTAPTASEPVSITPASPAINTTQQPATATVGTSIADKATVSGGYSPTGTVTFNLYNNANGTGTPLFTDTESLVNGSATSKGYVATAAGTDYWVATYNGNANNSSVTAAPASEPVSVTKAGPCITTAQQPATATVGSSIADKATVTGGYSPTGTVTFNLYGNSAGTGTPLFNDTETLVGGVATSKGYTATATATDYWVATYNGDSNNSSVTAPAASEPVCITKAIPAISTTQTPATAVVGTSIADVATVTGGYNPTGSVTFKLYNNATASGTPLFTDTESLVNGSATSKGYEATAAGTDYWVATYNGDSNNSSVTAPASSEPVTITLGTSISGTKYKDSTGNGLSCSESPLTGDTPEAGVTIELFTPGGTKPIAATVTAADGTYSFTGLPYGTYYVEEVVPSGQIQTGPTYVGTSTCATALRDSGFQSVPEGNGWGCYAYNPCGSNWNFAGQSGVSGNNSAFTSGDPSAPQGEQVAFLQDQGSISQSFSNSTAGWYSLGFLEAQRANNGVSNEDFQVLVDGHVVASCDPSGNWYQTCSTPSFYLGCGTHTVTFQGLDSRGGDNTAFLDNVCLDQNQGTVVNGANSTDYYSVTLAACSPTSSNDNFANFTECACSSSLTNVSYKVNGCGPYGDLGGHASQGATVSATFTVTGSTSTEVSLVSYVVPYNGAPLSSQIEYGLDTGTFAPGTHTISVTLPNGYYQVDFVCGAAISTFGPGTSNVTYHGEGRYISSDNGGSRTPTNYVTPPLANVQGDVGSVGTPGTEVYKNGTYTVTGGGADIWGTSDAFNYVYRSLDGDGEIVARVDGISNTDPWAKAGVMIRQSLDPGSPQASVFSTPGNGVVFQDREAQGGSSNSWSAPNSFGANSTTPVYVKLVRSGATITAYDSPNGLNWSLIGSDAISMTQQVYVGLAVTAHNNSSVATATFDNVSTGGYWCGGPGQSLIQSFGGGCNSTCVSNWLAQNYSNLYGCNAGVDNLSGQNNAAVACFVQAIEAEYGAESLEYLTLCTALDEYASTNGLGGSTACAWGFNTSRYGMSSEQVNTGGSCGTFGLSSSNAWCNVGQLLGDENAAASCGVLYTGNANNHKAAWNVIYQVSTRGY